MEDLVDELFDEGVVWLFDEVVAYLVVVVMVDHHHLDNRKSIHTFEKFLQEVLEFFFFQIDVSVILQI